MRSKPVPLNGSTVLLTGASSGIGRALALELSRRGARLAVVARRQPLLCELADEITAAGFPAPCVLPADLTDPTAVGAVAAAALTALGHVDILINNAGANMVGGQVEIGDGEPARSHFELNVWAPLALTSALAPGMLDAGRGTIVNVTSTMQAVPLPFTGYYSASKAALAGATQTLRLELRDTPIRVLEVVPGSTDTALRDIDLLPWRGRPPRTFPAVTPESVASAVVRALQGNRRRVVYPAYSWVPLELPSVGRLVGALAARRMTTDPAV